LHARAEAPRPRLVRDAGPALVAACARWDASLVGLGRDLGPGQGRGRGRRAAGWPELGAARGAAVRMRLEGERMGERREGRGLTWNRHSQGRMLLLRDLDLGRETRSYAMVGWVYRRERGRWLPN
jgi:hypothetical protein